MWSAEQDTITNYKKTSSNGRVISTTSSSIRSSSPPSIPPPPTPRTSMEELWKDISLSTIHEGMEANRNTTTPFEGIIVQDLLAKAFKEPSPTSASFDDLYLPPFSGLSLNSGHLVGYPDPNNPNSNSGASPAGFFAYCSKKRASEQQMEASFSNDNGADQRKKRMIKNRESAARSRARKQAHTQELKQVIAHLLDENRKLKYELSLAVEAQPPTKRTLQRASTAPF